VFNFLKLANTPQLTGLGGMNISNISNDIGLSFNNPALLRPQMHLQLSTVFNAMFAGIKNYHVMVGYRKENLQTNFALGVHYLDYGSIPQTDAAGNILGTFRPGDYVIQLSASRKYADRWNYGATVKFIHSNYGLYRSNGIAMDVGVTYFDSSNYLQVSMTAKNMGSQLRKYQGSNGDEIPFDLLIGITKRLQNAPVQFSLTGHHLHQFDISYNDTAFNNAATARKGFTLDKLIRHLVFAGQLYPGEKLEITAAYNHLRRTELNIANASNGINGFSLGVGVLFRKIQLRYARAYYQNNRAYNHFGLNLQLDEFTSKAFSNSQGDW
jgi:hypothetical protein